MSNDSDLQAQLQSLTHARSAVTPEEARARSLSNSDAGSHALRTGMRRRSFLLATGFALVVAIGAVALVTTLPNPKRSSTNHGSHPSPSTMHPTTTTSRPKVHPVPPPTSPQLAFNTGKTLQFENQSDGWLDEETAILRTSNGGRTWTKSYTGSVISIDFVDVLHGWALVSHGSVMRTVNGGKSWQTLRTARQGNIVYLDFTSALDGFALTENAELLSTEDGGSTWVTVPTPSPAVSVCAESSGQVWVAGDDRNIYLNAAGGGWKRVLSATSVPPIAEGNSGGELQDPILACIGTTAWVEYSLTPGMSEKPYVFERTVDDGLHWSAVLGAGQALPPSVKSISPDSGLIADFGAISASEDWVVAFCEPCGSQDLLFVDTTDGGATFSTSVIVPDARTYEFPVGFSVLNAQDAWALASEIPPNGGAIPVLLATSDGGVTWHVVNHSVY